MPQMPEVGKKVDEAMLLPFIPGLTPDFTQHLEFRFGEGGLPLQAQQTGSAALTCACDKPKASMRN